MKRLAIIDGKSVFYRGYYAMPNLSAADGTSTGGVYGFAALSLELIKKIEPDYVCVAWDKPKTNIRSRLKIYPDYKAGRKPAPADFYEQIPILHELLEAFSWPLYEFDDYEADDIMATLAAKAEATGDIETYLITSDLDALQMIDEHTYLYALKKGLSNIERFDITAFEAKYGIKINQFLDLKSLKGDSSDNIPGVPGVGEKTAVSLLNQFNTLDAVYDNLWQLKDSLRRKLETGKESAYMSRELARLFTDAPVELDLPAMDMRDLDTTRLKELLTRLEFRSLIRTLPEHMRQLDDSESVLNYGETAKIDAKDARAVLAMADQLVVYCDDDDNDKIWLSPEPGRAASLSRTEAANIITKSRIIAHDTKKVCRWLLEQRTDTLPEIVHDISQGSFLLNPLRKSRDLADLIGAESIEGPGQAISAIWALYEEHKKGFASQLSVSSVAHNIDFPLIPVLARMEHRGVMLDIQALDAMNEELTRDIEKIRTEAHTLVGEEFNLSSPSQLADVLFTKLQLPTTGIKKGKTGYSTGQKELNKLRGQHPIIELIEQYREYTKLQNTYVESLPKLVDENSRIHTTFNQDITATGRLSSTDPNLQNIPIRTELGRKIRHAFVPGDGNIFVSADYSQFELRLAAVLAGDVDMVNDFNAGTDIHAKVASEVFQVPLDDVTKNQRRAAKVVNFGVLYGMSAHGLAAAADMSFTEAKAFIDDYFKTHDHIKKYIDTTINKARDDGYVETLFGRRRPTPDVNSSNYIVRSAAERAAANMPIQGTEADLMKMAMIAVDEKIRNVTASSHVEPSMSSTRHKTSAPKRNSVARADYTEHIAPNQPAQILQVHDSIVVECSRNDADEITEILQETMENIYPKLGVRLQVDVTVGDNWGDV